MSTATEPLLELIADSLTLMNRSFTRVDDLRSYACEFYHQFRKMWDRGIPVGMGLGHITMKPIAASDLPAFLIERLAEKGQPARMLATVEFLTAKQTPMLPTIACEYEIAIIVGATDTIPSPSSMTIVFDIELWTAKMKDES